MKSKPKLFTFKTQLFQNKNNKQLSIVIPRKKIKSYLKKQGGVTPKEVKISLWSEIK